MVKRVLMIAYHFPPLHGSSGIQRTLSFVRDLPEFGWEPIVLTAHPRAYPSTNGSQLDDIEKEIRVYPAFAMDAARHLSINGRYPRLLALPDRWASWWLGAVPTGLHLIRKYRPDAIWSTYPIATAHLIGLSLCRLTNLPWVADFRDPMMEAHYPPNPLIRKVFGPIERATVSCARRVTLTTPGAARNYVSRFADLPASRFALLENGYDENSFADAQLDRSTALGHKQFVLVHSGIVYPNERDPVPLLNALADLTGQRLVSPASFKLILRATGNDEYLRRLIDQRGLGEMVALAPPLPYREALSEMLSADGLLLLQAANCNNQIPAKLYEYLRAQRPILALTDAAGDTAATLRKSGVDTIAPLDSPDAIKRALIRFLALAKAHKAPIAPMPTVLTYSRRSRAGDLAVILDDAANVPALNAARIPQK